MLASNYTFLNTTGDANKLTYFTPRFSGFQLGLSYTPSLAGGTGGSSNSYGNLPNNNGGVDPADPSRQEKIVEIGANYVNSFGGVDVAIAVVSQKFASDPALGQVLLATGNAVLAEAAPRDAIWGIGLDVGSPDVAVPARWRGQRVLIGWGSCREDIWFKVIPWLLLFH